MLSGYSGISDVDIFEHRKKRKKRKMASGYSVFSDVDIFRTSKEPKETNDLLFLGGKMTKTALFLGGKHACLFRDVFVTASLKQTQFP